MATRFPSARNFSASQITMGVLPVPPTVRLPTLITIPFNRFCFSQPLAYSHARTRTTTPYNSESGHNSIRNSGGTFIE
jgi:hypothetical protein